MDTSFGPFLQFARRLRKLTVAQLAERSGLPPQDIIDVEAGVSPNLDMLEKLGRGLEQRQRLLFESYDRWLHPFGDQQGPQNALVEIVGGDVHPRLNPSFRQARVLRALLSGLGEREGWALAMLPDLQIGPPQLGSDLLVPGLAGWRLEPGLDLGEGPHCKVPPSWVCELASRSLRLRMAQRAYARRHGVEHMWLLDLDARQLEVLERHGRRWVTIDRQSERLVGAAPFVDAEVDLGKVWA